MLSISAVEQIWKMFRPSVAIAPISCIRLMRNIGSRFLQVVILYIENFMQWMAWRTSPSICRCKATAQMNLTTMMLISLPFDMIPIWVPNPSNRNALYNASAIWIMNMKMLVLKLAASSSGSTFICYVRFLGSANTLNLCTGSLMRRSRSKIYWLLFPFS